MIMEGDKFGSTKEGKSRNERCFLLLKVPTQERIIL